MDKDITEELEENVMSLDPETTTTTQGNLIKGYCQLVGRLDMWYKDQNSPQRCVLPVSFPVDLLLWQ